MLTLVYELVGHKDLNKSEILFFDVYELYKKNYSFSTVYSGVKFLFFSVQNCQVFYFKNNKWQQ